MSIAVLSVRALDNSSLVDLTASSNCCAIASLASAVVVPGNSFLYFVTFSEFGLYCLLISSTCVFKEVIFSVMFLVLLSNPSSVCIFVLVLSLILLGSFATSSPTSSNALCLARERFFNCAALSVSDISVKPNSFILCETSVPDLPLKP